MAVITERAFLAEQRRRARLPRPRRRPRPVSLEQTADESADDESQRERQQLLQQARMHERNSLSALLQLLFFARRAGRRVNSSRPLIVIFLQLFDAGAHLEDVGDERPELPVHTSQLRLDATQARQLRLDCSQARKHTLPNRSRLAQPRVNLLFERVNFAVE